MHQDPLITRTGFLVIASKRHIRSISEMGQTEYDELAGLIRSTHYAIKEVTQIAYLTMVQEESSPHFHLWFFPWTQNVIEEYGRPSLDKIRIVMADLKKQPVSEADWNELEKAIKNMKAVVR